MFHRIVFRQAALAVSAGLALAGTAAAQDLDDAFRPAAAAATSPPQLPPPTPPGPQPASERSAALAQWQQANARVAEFPRGHIDILRWESAQSGDPKAAGATAAAPATTALATLVTQALQRRPALVDAPGLSPLEQAQRRADMAEVVRDVQRAWLAAVAARARLARATDTLENARTGAELGRRMMLAGNWSRLRHLNELQIETAARQSWLAAGLAERVAVEQLARSLGIWQPQALDTLRRHLPGDLPAPASAAPTEPPLGPEGAALHARPDLLSDYAATARLPQDIGTMAWTAAHARALMLAVDAAGPVTLPHLADRRALLDHRSAHTVQARARLLLSVSHLRSQAREAWAALQAHHALARLAQDETLAHQEAREQDVLQRYNGMLVSTWDLLGAARERLAALDSVTQARLAYWQAEADWRALLAGAPYAGADSAPFPGGAAARSAGGH